MRWVHFYPFSPLGDHGGTLRLRTAELACSHLGEQQTFWFDSAAQTWQSDLPHGQHAGEVARPGLKRRVFPSTLYESGRSAVKAFREADWHSAIPASSNVIFHTTYLGPLLADSRPPWLSKAVIDIYDLVWRAHLLDSGLSSGPARPMRLLYSKSVKRRETRFLARADAVAVAGYEDWRHIQSVDVLSAWCPTGMIAQTRNAGVPREPPVIGFLGNFAHQPTVDSARYLLSCPAARTGGVRVLLAGWESLRFSEEFSGRAEILGPVESPGDFWQLVDCAVIPVQTGAGMKCKISEAILAGCPVITTSLGAEGFPPGVRQLMHVVEGLDEITSGLCRDIGRPDPTSAALRDLTREGAAKRYAELLSAAG